MSAKHTAKMAPQPGVTDGAPSAGARWVGTAFGLELDSTYRFPGLRPSTAQRRSGTRVRRVEPDSISEVWPDGACSRVLERRRADGSLGIAVDEHPEFGYRIEAPHHGVFRVSSDAASIEVAAASGPRWHAFRPLFAQVLPIAAALRGFEVFHASAVEIDGKGIAFTGHPGAGKSSLACHLVAQGATLITDDALAVSATEAGVRAHSGGHFINLAEEQYTSMSDPGRARLGEVVGRTDKLHLAIGALAPHPVPLDALYFLRRGADVPQPTVEAIDPPDPAALLGSTFLSHVRRPERLLTQLQVCSEIAAKTEVLRLQAPAETSASDLARFIRERTGESGSRA